MATTPAFANVPIVGTGIASATADVSLTAPTNAATLSWSTAIGASGAKVEEVRVLGLATTVLGLVNLFLHDGSTYHFVDTIIVPALTLSTTTPVPVIPKTYDKLWIPSGWGMRFTVSIAGLQSNIKVVAFGANL